MALRRLSTSSIQTNGKSSKLWDQTTFQSGMFALATVSLTSTASSITFSGIPNTYKHLQLRYTAQSNRDTYGIDNSKITINSDTGSNYSFHILNGDGNAAFASGSASQTFIKSGDRDLATTTSTSIFGVGVIDFLDYSNTNKYKTIRTLSGEDINGTIAGFGGGLSLSSGLWMNSAAEITSITLVPQNGTAYTQYSSFALYGIKAG